VPEQTCPSCGSVLPPELAQHALTPASGLVRCPTCGETVTLEKPEDSQSGVSDSPGEVPDTAGEPESFSGEETIEGVMEELADKPGGPGSDE
jgi:uncharacterized Zn finger protein (UPF0148 family)